MASGAGGSSEGGAAAQPKRGREKEAKDKSGDKSDDESSSTGPVPKRVRVPSIPFSLSALEAEVADLRANPPPFVHHIGELHTPLAVCDEDGAVVPTKPGEGPWDLVVCISGKEGDDAYGYPFRVNLRFDRDLWPSKLALVRFQCVFHHALTDDSDGMLMPFYRRLPRDERQACTVRLVVQAVHNFLVDPLTAWGIPAEKAPKNFSEAIAAHRKMNASRMEVIRKYAALKVHPDLFASPPKWKKEWLEPSFAEAVEKNTPESWRALLTEHLPGEVFSFKLLTEEFCKMLVAEIYNFYESGLTARRPNSMNNYGIILNEIGLEPLIDELQRMLQPLGHLIFPGPGSEWDGHHCFIVRYREGEDLGLDMHTDDSDVTFNLCLGVDFEGAGLQFCGLMGAPDHRKHTYTYKHVKGSCVFHLGRKRHGADDISKGERLNLILWNHSSAYRQSDDYVTPPYKKEESAPDPVCVSYTHDRDYGNYKDYPPGKERMRGRGWCPRLTYEYPGFKPDCEKERMGA